MRLDQQVPGHIMAIESFEPSFNVSASVVVTEMAPSEQALISIEQHGDKMISISVEHENNNNTGILNQDVAYSEEEKNGEDCN